MSGETQKVANRSAGRRREDQGHQQKPRERRKPAAQTKAAAQSVVMAHLADKPKKKVKAAQAAHLYTQTAVPKPEPSAAKDRPAAKDCDAEFSKRKVQKGWSFERRKKQIPRTTTIEDAEIL